ncbi:MAG: nucleotidyltransferase domain-containing protein [Bacteroidia bacterium]
MLNRKTAIETATGFINDLKLLGYNPTQAWLFGSVVSGKMQEYSDIDLALWDEQFTGVLHLDGEKIKMLLLKYKWIELHSYPSKVTENEDPFIGEIKKTGERIL